MAQMERLHRNVGSGGSQHSGLTMEQLLNYDTTHSPVSHEEEQSQSSRKSVLSKMKEKTKRWRDTLGKKKQTSEDNTTPAWGVSFEDEDEDEEQDVEPEYLGAPMYESELAPEVCKEAARQHPRANPVISDKHMLATNFTTQRLEELDEEKGNRHNDPNTQNKTTTQTVTNKLAPARDAVTATLAPAYATVSDATRQITSKIIPGKADSSIISPSTSARNIPINSTARVGSDTHTSIGDGIVSSNADNTHTSSVSGVKIGTNTDSDIISPNTANNTSIAGVARKGTNTNSDIISPKTANNTSNAGVDIKSPNIAGVDIKSSNIANNTSTTGVSRKGTSTDSGIISPNSANNTSTAGVVRKETGTGSDIISPNTANNTSTAGVVRKGTNTGSDIISPNTAKNASTAGVDIKSPNNANNTSTAGVACKGTITNSDINTSTAGVARKGTNTGSDIKSSNIANNTSTTGVACKGTNIGNDIISPNIANNTSTSGVARNGTSTGNDMISPNTVNNTSTAGVARKGTSIGSDIISPNTTNNTSTIGVARKGTGTGSDIISPNIANNTSTDGVARKGTNTGAGIGSRQQQWDKGVSVKEYLTHKLEPGEEERALSQVITEAISPRKRTTGGPKHEEGVVEKVKDVVSSLLWSSNDSTPSPSATMTTAKTKPSNNVSTKASISSNANSAVEEEQEMNKGRILQAN